MNRRLGDMCEGGAGGGVVVGGGSGRLVEPARDEQRWAELKELCVDNSFRKTVRLKVEQVSLH